MVPVQERMQSTEVTAMRRQLESSPSSSLDSRYRGSQGLNLRSNGHWHSSDLIALLNTEVSCSYSGTSKQGTPRAQQNQQLHVPCRE